MERFLYDKEIFLFMDTKAFEDIGLTKAEIKVYLSLLELGSTTAGPVIKKANVQSSVVHNALLSLLEKGLINYILKGKIRHYSAADPHRFLDFVEEKKRNFKEILPQLLLKQKMTDVNEAKVYQGLKGVMTALVESITYTKKGDEWLFFSADFEPKNEEVQKFFSKFDPKRKAKGLKVKGIAPKRLKHLYEEREKKGFMTMKYTENNIPPNMSICKDTINLYVWGETPMAFEINAKQLAEKYRDFFYNIWNSLK